MDKQLIVDLVGIAIQALPFAALIYVAIQAIGPQGWAP